MKPKNVINKMKALDKAPKFILAIGLPILLILFTIGTMEPITDALNLGPLYYGINPFNIEYSWWIWSLALISVMIFEWILFTPENKNEKSHKNISGKKKLDPFWSSQLKTLTGLLKLTVSLVCLFAFIFGMLHLEDYLGFSRDITLAAISLVTVIAMFLIYEKISF